MMSVAATLLELVDGRMTASEVLDLAAAAPVRRRFGFDDDELARLTEWVAEAQVRWGLDAAHRAAFKLDGFSAEHLGGRPRPASAGRRDG